MKKLELSTMRSLVLIVQLMMIFVCEYLSRTVVLKIGRASSLV